MELNNCIRGKIEENPDACKPKDGEKQAGDRKLINNKGSRRRRRWMK